MRISDPNSSRVPGVGQKSGVSSTDGGRRLQGPAGQSFSNDQIQLSNLSSTLAAAQAKSPAWMGKLANLTAAVGNGSYAVDTHAVSAKIIDDSLQAAA